MSENITIALIGIGGAVVGSIATMAGNVLMHWLKQRSDRKKDEPRRALLREMLGHPDHKWRNLDALKHVIGTDEENTKSLLLEIGARASEDGKQLWGRKSRNPLPK